MRVLVADDSSGVRVRLGSVLCEIEGLEIAGLAPDIPTALDSIRRLNPDVVIIDVRLCGDMSIDALRTIKRRDPAPIVLVFTNYTDTEYREKWMCAGADFFFSKSTELNPMLDTLRALLKTGRLIQCPGDPGNSNE